MFDDDEDVMMLVKEWTTNDNVHQSCLKYDCLIYDMADDDDGSYLFVVMV
jgi:hypothetical protein